MKSKHNLKPSFQVKKQMDSFQVDSKEGSKKKQWSKS